MQDLWQIHADYNDDENDADDSDDADDGDVDDDDDDDDDAGKFLAETVAQTRCHHQGTQYNSC